MPSFRNNNIGSLMVCLFLDFNSTINFTNFESKVVDTPILMMTVHCLVFCWPQCNSLGSYHWQWNKEVVMLLSVLHRRFSVNSFTRLWNTAPLICSGGGQHCIQRDIFYHCFVTFCRKTNVINLKCLKTMGVIWREGEKYLSERLV
jgi:hypothetical protein